MDWDLRQHYSLSVHSSLLYPNPNVLPYVCDLFECWCPNWPVSVSNVHRRSAELRYPWPSLWSMNWLMSDFSPASLDLVFLTLVFCADAHLNDSTIDCHRDHFLAIQRLYHPPNPHVWLYSLNHFPFECNPISNSHSHDCWPHNLRRWYSVRRHFSNCKQPLHRFGPM